MFKFGITKRIVFYGIKDNKTKHLFSRYRDITDINNADYLKTIIKTSYKKHLINYNEHFDSFYLTIPDEGKIAIVINVDKYCENVEVQYNYADRKLTDTEQELIYNELKDSIPDVDDDNAIMDLLEGDLI